MILQTRFSFHEFLREQAVPSQIKIHREKFDI
jgi:hypothetical protein